MTRVYSPVTEGSGVQVVHQGLSKLLPDYDVRLINPWRSLLPHSLPVPKLNHDVAHSLPDLAGYGVPDDMPLIVTFHGFYLDKDAMRRASPSRRVFYRIFLRRFVERALNRATVVTAVSTHVSDLVKETCGIRPVVIRNGVDPDQFRPSQRVEIAKRLRVLFSGNLRPQKGVDLLQSLAGELADCCEFIVASGLRKHESSLVGQNFTRLGRIRREQMPEVYANSDVLLLPTLREGMSLVTLEAMSSGLPVVTTTIPPQRELIVPERGGLLCRPGDAHSFAAALRRLAKDPGAREAMGCFNRARVKQYFSSAESALLYQQLFDSVKVN